VADVSGGRTDPVAAVRRFNRFYTRRIGVLGEGLLRSEFSLAEVRVMYELSHREGLTAAELAADLGMDAGYLSRVLRGLQGRGLVARTASAEDRRRSHLRLTKRGARTFAELDARQDEEVAALLDPVPSDERGRLLAALESIERLLGAAGPAQAAPYVLRPPRAGDLGWVVHRHGVLYAREYGWDERFEGLVARVVADYVANHDPRRERCWIAERHGEPVGSVFVVKQSEAVAKLRLLLVEPSARGLGIGARLVDECVRFARDTGYRKLVLWTNSVLTAARRIYEQKGFTIVATEEHDEFGVPLVAETWELKL
jgi:DNA-binding MarR family transcriptional regulator/predicted N-acetyltransferase YhbS